MKHLHYLYSIMLLGFLLGTYNGRIALWKDEDPEPVRVFPYRVSVLPKDAQAALKKGIAFENLEQLKAKVKDYLP